MRYKCNTKRQDMIIIAKSVSKNAQSQITRSSHLWKHTANVIRSALSPTCRVFMMVVQLRTAHSHIRRPGTWSPSNASSIRDTRGRSAGPCHVAPMLRLYCFPVVDLGHPSHSPTPQTRVLVAVPPTIDRALDQATLSAQARIQLGEGPSDRVAFSLVVEAISLVLILMAAGTRVNAVFGLELLRKFVDID